MDRSIQIDKQIQQDKQEFLNKQKEPKILILGSGDSGKTTLLKQIQIIHGNGYSPDQLLEFKVMLVQSILVAVRFVAEHVQVSTSAQDHQVNCFHLG